MKNSNECREIMERFPMLVNDRLNPEEAASVESHLKECASCRLVFDRERVLFRLAASDTPQAPLAGHPESRLLDLYAHSSVKLTAIQLSELETHLADCELCREAVDKLKQLPESPDELVGPEDLPFLSGLERARVTEVEPKSFITDIRRRVTWNVQRTWRPVAAFAAATMIAFIAISQMPSDQPDPTATVEALFPAITRGLQKALVFESDERSFILRARVFVGPEDGCTYGLKVYSPERDSVLYRMDNVKEFDSLGFTRFELPMELGRYQMILYDVIGNDTLEVVKPFAVRLRE